MPPLNHTAVGVFILSVAGAASGEMARANQRQDGALSAETVAFVITRSSHSSV
jgi:hypothetical protein